MLCPACDSNNPPDARACRVCGAPLEPMAADSGDEDRTCPACGGGVAVGAKFCPHCGHGLMAGAGAPPPKRPRWARRPGELSEALAVVIASAIGLGAGIYWFLLRPSQEAPVALTSPPATSPAPDVAAERDLAAEPPRAGAAPAPESTPRPALGEEDATARYPGLPPGPSAAAPAPSEAPPAQRAPPAAAPAPQPERYAYGNQPAAPGAAPAPAEPAPPPPANAPWPPVAQAPPGSAPPPASAQPPGIAQPPASAQPPGTAQPPGSTAPPPAAAYPGAAPGAAQPPAGSRQAPPATAYAPPASPPPSPTGQPPAPAASPPSAGGAAPPAVAYAPQAGAPVPQAAAPAPPPSGRLPRGDETASERIAAARRDDDPPRSPAPKAGRQVYLEACVQCHGNTPGSALRLDDTDAWRPRLAGGRPSLYRSVTGGATASHPSFPRRSLTPAELRAGVDYVADMAWRAVAAEESRRRLGLGAQGAAGAERYRDPNPIRSPRSVGKQANRKPSAQRQERQARRLASADAPARQAAEAGVQRSWLVSLRGDLARCRSEESVIGRVLCGERARWKHCHPGRWGKVQEC